jgi:hypothetical protein
MNADPLFGTARMADDVNITLTLDEALVLFEFFSRFEEADGEFALRHNAEYIAFSRISAQLDKSLVEVFDANYAQRLGAARERVAAGYEGRAPGVRDGAK